MSSVIFPGFTKLKLDLTSVLGAYAFGLVAVYLNRFALEWVWQWNVYFGFGSAMAFLLLKGRLIDKKAL